MEKVYRLLPWLSAAQAVDYLAYLTGKTLNEDLLLRLCDAGECAAYLDCTGRRGIAYFEGPQGAEKETSVCGFMHSRLLSVKAFARATRIPVFGEYESVFLGFQEDEWWLERVFSKTWPGPELEFKPADIEALAAKMNGEPALPRTTEAATKQQADEPSSKSRNAYLRTIAALGYALIDGSSGQPHTDPGAILAALAAKGIEAPIKPEALAGYLKQAEKI